MFEECKKKIDAKKLDKVCVATSLVFDINKHLVPFIRFIDELGISNKVLFCTSYDTKYRFHT